MTRQAKRIIRYLKRDGQTLSDLVTYERGLTVKELQVKLRMPEGTLRRELPALCRDLYVHQSEDHPARYTATFRAYSLRLR